MAAGFQEAVADVTMKAVRAATELGVSTLLIAGGVAANSRLRELADERCAAAGDAADPAAAAVHRQRRHDRLVRRTHRRRRAAVAAGRRQRSGAAGGAGTSRMSTGAEGPPTGGTSRSRGTDTADRLAITELLYRYAELVAGDFDGVGRLLGRATFAGTRSSEVSGAAAIAAPPRPPGAFRTSAPRGRATWCSTRRGADSEDRHRSVDVLRSQATDTVRCSRSWSAGTRQLQLRPDRSSRLVLHRTAGRRGDGRGRVGPPDVRPEEFDR